MNHTPELIAVYARAIERLLIVISAMGALVIGWNLFKIGVVMPQSGELRGKGWSVKLQRCGPGIFFALFGTAVLIWAINSRFSTIEQPSTGSGQRQISLSYLGGSQGVSRELAQSINRISVEWNQAKQESQIRNDSARAAARAAGDRAVNNLETLRDTWIRSTYGDQLDIYKRVKSNESGASEDERRVFNEIGEWYKPLPIQ